MGKKITERFAVVEVAAMPPRHRHSMEPWSPEAAQTAVRDVLAEMKKVLPRLLSDYELDFVWKIEDEAVCEHCGFHWTEDSSDYNGGCCDADEANSPRAEQVPA